MSRSHRDGNASTLPLHHPEPRYTNVNTSEQSTDRLDEQFARRLATFIADEVADADESIEPDTDLLVTGLVDSLGVVMIVDWLERELAIAIDPGDVVLEHFQSVEAMLAYLRTR